MMKLSKISLFLIIALSFLIRGLGLDMVPPALNWDEVSHGFNAYSILKTGTDEWGETPLANFRAYGDYPLPVNMYLLIPFISAFGLNEVSVRLPGAIYGTLLVLVVYFLAKQLFKDQKTALLASLIVGISPWTILTSRQVLQATPAVLFLSSGILVFLKGEKDKRWFFLGTFFLGLSAYTYHNTRILAPIIFIMLIFFYRDSLLKFKYLLISLILFSSVFFIPLFFIVTSGQGSARAVWVGIINTGAINAINESRGQSNLPGVFPRLVHNKVAFFATTAAKNYLGYFSPRFLAFEGGTHYQFSVPHMGVIFPILLPFFYLGVTTLILNFRKNSKTLKILTLLLLITPIPAAITSDPYQVVRAATMMPFISIITALGFNIFYSYLKNKINIRIVLTGVFLIGLLIFLINYLTRLFYVYPNEYSFAWQYGQREVANYIQQNQDNYQNIYITKKYGEPHEFLLFYLKYDPSEYKHDPNLVRYPRSDWFWVDRFNKYNFVNDWEIKDKTKVVRNSLLITSPGNYPDNGQLLETVYFLDNTPSFDIVKLP